MNRREKIILVRSLLNMDTQEFGSALGYGQSTIRLMENGSRRVTDGFCESLTEAFGVNGEWLMGEDSGEEPTVEEIFTNFYEVDGVVYPRKALVPAHQAKRIREVLESTGKTQKEFCQETGWTVSNLKDLLNAKRKLSYRYAERLEKRFNVGTEWLLYGIEEEKNCPVDSEMIKFLRENEKARRAVKKMMEVKSIEEGKKAA